MSDMNNKDPMDERASAPKSWAHRGVVTVEQRLSDFFRDDVLPAHTRRATRARLAGEFDHPDLQRYGPFGDTLDDVRKILQAAQRSDQSTAESTRAVMMRALTAHALTGLSGDVAGRFLVTWTIDSDAETPEEAAQEAWAAMRRESSIANVFDVVDHAGVVTTVDMDTLSAEDEDRPGAHP